QAGSGKTTLLKHMCKALSTEESESDYDLVLYFPLRDRSVSGASDLQSLLKYYGSEDSRLNHTTLAQSMVESKGRGLLFVLDGADEVKDLLQQSSGSTVQSLLMGPVLPEAHIIISSRPGACPSLQDHTATFYEVQGFDHDAITSYVKSFFEANPHAADRMLSQLDSRPDLLGGMYIPMNCFILCSIFEHDSSFPATMTACYQAFAAHTISRECSREGREVHIDPTLRDLPRDVDDLMSSLGRLSYNGLCENPPRFVFDESSIRAAFPKLPPGAPIDESLFKGLLHVHASRKGYQSSLSFSFPHATQQEFFAALHVSRLPPKEQAQFWKENLSNISFSVVLRFYAGLTGLSVPKVAKQLCTSSLKESRDEPLLEAFQNWIFREQKDECSNEKP
ncbi:MAG: NACHT domain-containing protein, partial [Alphaproteobacteria bacterium]|nr:NACHT domain-containing protein [Alphaproteobacteria bacterium]